MPPRSCRLAILCAIAREIEPLIAGWEQFELDVAGTPRRAFAQGDVIVVCGGIGAQSARQAAETILRDLNPGLLVSAGFAGALVRDLRAGEVITFGTVIDDANGKHYENNSGAGTLVTAAGVMGPAAKVDLARRHPAQAVDMEASAVAAMAEEHQVSFVAIKSISDEFDFVMPPMERFLDATGAFKKGRFALYAALHPGTWGAVSRLAVNSRKAAQSLSAALQQLIAGSIPAAISENVSLGSSAPSLR